MDKSEMFEYIGKDNTLYDKIGKYFPTLNGDFSTASLLNHLKEQYSPDGIINKTYNETFNLISNNLVNAVKKCETGNYSEITPQQVSDLILELKNFDADSYRKDLFETVEEYVDYARYKIDSSDTKKIREIIIKFGIDILPEKNRDSIRTSLLEIAYIPKIGNFLKSKYSLEEKNTESEEKGNLERESGLEEIERAYTVLKTSKLRKLYDSYLKDFMFKKEEVEKRLVLLQKCAAKRDFVVAEEIKSTMGTNEQNSATLNNNLLYPILGALDVPIPRRGKYDWEFIEYDQPQLITNSIAKYSPNGVENQRVIVANHGRMNFKIGGKDNVSEELLGITRIGEDKERTYFVAVPRGSTQQISKEREEFFSKIFTSDYYLEQVERDYNRFAGTIIMKQGKPKIVKETISVIGSDERDALNYAQNYNGKYNSRKATLEDICHPHSRIPQKHKALVDFVKETNVEKEAIVDSVNENIHNKFSEAPVDPEGDSR